MRGWNGRMEGKREGEKEGVGERGRKQRVEKGKRDGKLN